MRRHAREEHAKHVESTLGAWLVGVREASDAKARCAFTSIHDDDFASPNRCRHHTLTRKLRQSGELPPPSLHLRRTPVWRRSEADLFVERATAKEHASRPPPLATCSSSNADRATARAGPASAANGPYGAAMGDRGGGEVGCSVMLQMPWTSN